VSQVRVLPPSPSPSRGTVDGVLYCFGGCGRRYADFGLDVLLPTSLWNRIAVGPPFDETQEGIEREGRGGVLCAQCIVDRLATIQNVSAAFIGVDRPVERPTGWAHGTNAGGYPCWFCPTCGAERSSPPPPSSETATKASGWEERHRWPPFTHGRIVCKCGAVVAQCRCPEGCQTVGTVETCAKCLPPSPQPSSETAKEPERA
jgi:hypothetical protein